MTVEEQDPVEELVLAAIGAVQSGNRADIVAAYEALAPLETREVIAELFLWVQDLTSNVAEGSLLKAVELPLPPRPTEMLRAIADRDLGGLQTAVGSERFETVFASLLVLIAALKDARAKL